jgi:23S rRNA pseudouridine2604 synthase
MPSKLRTFLAKKLRISNTEALKLLIDKKVFLNGEPVNGSSVVNEKDEVSVNGKVIQQGKDLTYLKFYKPRGIESTLNKNIPNNLSTAFKHREKLFPVGRLDKDSEGLMILTNDGQFYKHVTAKDNTVEKEYLVIVNKPFDEDFIHQMGSGIKIMGKMTKPARLEKGKENNSFYIVLTEGMNRQIRRMCYKLGYEVISLKRIRIGNVKLENLKEGDQEEIKGGFISRSFRNTVS